MSDLRTGLVEAIARALHASVDTSARLPWDELDWRTQVRWLHRGSLALDTTLGFLTDNAVRNNEEMQPVVELLAELRGEDA